MDDTISIFISYARPDREAAEQVFEWLSRAGYQPWMDSKKIKPGQNWENEIDRAFRQASIVVSIWSKNSINRRGYIQREIRMALDQHKEKLIDDIYIIPVLLDDDLEFPEQMRHLHCLRYSDANARTELFEAIGLQVVRLGGQRNEISKEEDVSWQKRKWREEWNGLPGYRFEADHFEFSSTKHSDIRDIGNFLKGELLVRLFESRRTKFEQDSAFYNFAQDEWQRTYTTDIYLERPVFCGTVVSLPFAISWYHGGAHPTHGFMTYSFVLNPLIRIENLSEIFQDPDKAFSVVQSVVTTKLKDQYRSPDIDENFELDLDMLREGTSDWDAFDKFSFDEKGVTIYFSSYDVGPYAIGTPQVKIGYEILVKNIKDHYVSALQLQSILYHVEALIQAESEGR